MTIESTKEQLIENAAVAPSGHWYLVSWKAAGGTFGHADVGLDEPWARGSSQEAVELIAGAYPELQGKTIIIQSVMPIASEIAPEPISGTDVRRESREDFEAWYRSSSSEIEGHARESTWKEGLWHVWEESRTAALGRVEKSSPQASVDPQQDVNLNVSSLVCRSDERNMEMPEITAGAIKFIGSLGNGFCQKHPGTARLTHPLMQTASYPSQPVMYCPKCEPAVAEWAESNQRVNIEVRYELR